MSEKGVYLIHFQRHYKHAQHYIGYSKDIRSRLSDHSKGIGARLLQVIQDCSIEWACVRVWKEKDRTFERRLKKQKHSSKFCPICSKKI